MKVLRSVSFLAAVVFVLGADPALAQSITANGSGSAISISRGSSVAINAAGAGYTNDWVGLYAVGAPNGAYMDWY